MLAVVSGLGGSYMQLVIMFFEVFAQVRASTTTSRGDFRFVACYDLAVLIETTFCRKIFKFPTSFIISSFRNKCQNEKKKKKKSRTF